MLAGATRRRLNLDEIGSFKNIANREDSGLVNSILEPEPLNRS
jgi:hypothetical protein